MVPAHRQATPHTLPRHRRAAGQGGAQLRPSPQGDSHAWWVEDVLDSLGLRRVLFVGPSYGAGIILRTAGYAPERVSGAVLISPAGIATGPLGRVLLETVVRMMAYRLRPSRERRLRAARAIPTEPDELAERPLGAIYRHVKLGTKLPRMATEEELKGFGEPVALFASEQDVFSPGRCGSGSCTRDLSESGSGRVP